MLDSGSNQTFIRAQVARDLGCRVLSSDPLKVETFGGGQTTSQLTRRVQVTLRAGMKPGITVDAYEMPEICTAPPNATRADLRQYPHLTGLQLAELSDQSCDQEGDVLIGLDHFQDVISGDIKRGPVGPVAMSSCFGWILAGRLEAKEESSTPTISNFIQARQTEPRSQLETLWSLEGIGISATGAETDRKKEEDDDVMQHFNSTCSRLPDGRYQV